MLAPKPRCNPGTRPLRRGHPSGHIPLRPGVCAQQVWHHLQGCRKDARLCRPAHQVPPLEILYAYASVIPVTQRDTTRNMVQTMLNWCKLKVQFPHHKGGYAISPTAASGLAAFYSATSRFVTLLARLPHGDAWVRDGQDLADHDTWSNSQLQALSSRPTPASFRTTNAQNGNRKITWPSFTPQSWIPSPSFAPK